MTVQNSNLSIKLYKTCSWKDWVFSLYSPNENTLMRTILYLLPFVTGKRESFYSTFHAHTVLNNVFFQAFFKQEQDLNFKSLDRKSFHKTYSRSEMSPPLPLKKILLTTTIRTTLCLLSYTIKKLE